MEQNTLRKQRELTDRLNRYRNECPPPRSSRANLRKWGLM